MKTLLCLLAIVGTQGQGPRTPYEAENQRLGFKGVVTGRVVYEDGRPAAGYKVVAALAIYLSLARGAGETYTDENGNYEIHYLGSVALKVSVDNEGQPFVPSQMVPVDLSKASRADHVDFTLYKGPHVKVRVRDAETGKPVSGLVVSSTIGFSSLLPLGRTDSEGTFDVYGNSWYVKIGLGERNGSYGAAPGSSFYFEKSMKPHGDVVWDVLAYSRWWQKIPTVFTGTVVDPKGVAVPGARVILRQSSHQQIATTDEQGKFQFNATRLLEDKEKGDANVLFVQKGELTSIQALSAPDTWGPMRVTLRPTKLATATGRVVDVLGKPVADCIIQYQESFTYPIGNVSLIRSGKDGRFSIKGLNPMSLYSFSFGNPPEYARLIGMAPMPKSNVIKGAIAPKAGTTDLGDVVVPRGDGELAGRIVDPDGKPCTNGISVALEGEHCLFYPTVLADGSFSCASAIREPLTLKVLLLETDLMGVAKPPRVVLTQAVRAGDRNLRLVVKLP